MYNEETWAQRISDRIFFVSVLYTGDYQWMIEKNGVEPIIKVNNYSWRLFLYS